MTPEETLKIKRRIELLEEFHRHLSAYCHGDSLDPEIRRYLNRNMRAVHGAVDEAGTLQLITITPPPALGGPIMRNTDPFGNLFQDFYGMSLIPAALDSIEQAIGVYEHIAEDTGMVHLASRQAIDIEGAIERALRPYFRSEPPRNEREVQDAVDVILRSLGVDHSREKDVAVVGERSFKPDFVVPDDDLAIEVKYARQGRELRTLQEEIAADVAAYRTKWKRLLVVVYDAGTIADPYLFRRSHMQSFGVSVVVIKH